MGVRKVMSSLNILKSLNTHFTRAMLPLSLSPSLFLKYPTLTNPSFSSVPQFYSGSCSNFGNLVGISLTVCGQDSPNEFPRFHTSMVGIKGGQLVTLSEEEEKEIEKMKIERIVLYPDSFNIERIREAFCLVFSFATSAGKQVNALYYGVTVVQHGMGKTPQEEADLLNKEVAFKDAVHKIASEYAGQESIRTRSLAEEPTANWISEDRIKPSDEEALDLVLSVNIDDNDISEEVLANICQKGTRNVLWIVTTKAVKGCFAGAQSMK